MLTITYGFLEITYFHFFSILISILGNKLDGMYHFVFTFQLIISIIDGMNLPNFNIPSGLVFCLY